MLLTPVFWPGEFHGMYSPWGRKESDTTEGLSLSLRAGGAQRERTRWGSGRGPEVFKTPKVAAFSSRLP